MSDEVNVSQAETMCIRTTKVYDWCYKNGTTPFTLTDFTFPADTSTVAGVECDIVSITCAELGRSQSGGGIAVVTLRKQATFEITFVDASGNPVPVLIGTTPVDTQTRTRFWDEFVQVCSPEGTSVTCEISNSGCRGTLTAVNGTNAVAVEIYVCQSIYVEAEVKVCVDIVDYCLPDVCEPTSKPFSCPPTEFYPPPCSSDDPRYTPPCSTETSSIQRRRS